MADLGNTEAAAMRLAELSREIDELENGRAALLKRVDQLRSNLQSAGQRTSMMRASVHLLSEHVTNIIMALAELRALEDEICDMERGLESNGRETAGLLFEADGLEDTLDETEAQIERLSIILLEGKAKPPRGH